MTTTVMASFYETEQLVGFCVRCGNAKAPPNTTPELTKQSYYNWPRSRGVFFFIIGGSGRSGGVFINQDGGKKKCCCILMRPLMSDVAFKRCLVAARIPEDLVTK